MIQVQKDDAEQLKYVSERAKYDILAFALAIKEDYQINWHHRRIAQKLNAFMRGEIPYLMIFMPPRHGKSQLVSRFLPAFLHGIYPDCEIMAASYLDTLAGEMTIDVQKIIDSPMYRRIFPETKIYKSGIKYTTGIRNSSEHHIVGRKGKYRGQGVGGSFTGKGANFAIIDDPIKGREIADSEAHRERIWKFYNNDLFSRLETDLKDGRKGQVLITMTRWHEDDIAGRLLSLAKEDPSAVQWDVLNYPAIRINEDDKTDPRQVGDPLWPEKYGLTQLNQIKASSGVRAWGSLYQQDPVPDGVGLFRPEMFAFVDLPQQFDWSFITADTAYKEKQENDFTVFSCWGVNANTVNGVTDLSLFLRNVWRRQIKASDIEPIAETFIRKYLGYGFRNTWIEPKGHGIYLNQAFARKGLMIPTDSEIQNFYSDRRFDKVERANNIIPHLAFRKVYISNEIPEKEELSLECLRFPKATHDDFVDCLIDAVKITYAREVSILDSF